MSYVQFRKNCFEGQRWCGVIGSGHFATHLGGVIPWMELMPYHSFLACAVTDVCVFQPARTNCSPKPTVTGGAHYNKYIHECFHALSRFFSHYYLNQYSNPFASPYNNLEQIEKGRHARSSVLSFNSTMYRRTWFIFAGVCLWTVPPCPTPVGDYIFKVLKS